MGPPSSAGRAEETLELLPRNRWDRADLRVFLDVRGCFHSDERRLDPRRGAHELERALRVGREPGNVLGDHRRQLGELALVEGGPGHHRDAELSGGLEDRNHAVLYATLGPR